MFGSPAGAAQAPVGLGTATGFAVLAGSGITNDIPGTVITGDIGSFPTTTITDTGIMTLNGTNHGGDAVTQSAKNDLQTAFDDAAGRLPEIAADADFVGETLTPGVYANGTLGLTGVLTLDFQNDATAQFVFKAASTLITAAGSSVVMINTTGNDACRVVWKVGSSATFDTTTSFVGDVLAHTSITANTGATFQGRLLALNGAVTLLDNTINRDTCATITPTATTTTTTTTIDTGNGGGSGVTTPTTSTTSTSTTSTTAASATSTTSATAPTTTSTLLPATVPTLPDGPVAIAGFPTPPGVDLQVVPPPTDTPDLPELPRTGSDTLLLAVLGATMVLVGAAILRIERRARTSSTR